MKHKSHHSCQSSFLILRYIFHEIVTLRKFGVANNYEIAAKLYKILLKLSSFARKYLHPLVLLFFGTR